MLKTALFMHFVEQKISLLIFPKTSFNTFAKIISHAGLEVGLEKEKNTVLDILPPQVPLVTVTSLPLNFLVLNMLCYDDVLKVNFQ